MVSSPFLGIADNATLIFDVPSSDTTEDDLGNVISATSPRRVRAFLKRNLGKQKTIVRNDSIDESATYYEGYCVSPMILPLGVKRGDWAEMDLSGDKGFFYLDSINPKFGSGGIGEILVPETGTAIEGWFQAKK